MRKNDNKYRRVRGTSFLEILSCSRIAGEDQFQPRPQGLLLVQNGGQRNPWPRLPKWLQKFVRISSRKHDEMSSFCLNNGFRLQKKTGLPDAGNNLRKSHFIMCHVTKYSTIRGVFQRSLGQGFLRPPF